MKGQPWPELELGGRRWELAWKGTDGGRRAGVGRLAVEDKEGAPWGAAWRRARPLFLLRTPVLLLPCACCVQEERRRSEEKREKRKRRKEREREKEKNKMEKIQNLKILRGKNKRKFTKLV
jgi:hypothetical protein